MSLISAHHLLDSHTMIDLMQTCFYDRSDHQLPELQPGDTVRLRNIQVIEWDRKATVLKKVLPRSYNVGALYRRNLKHLLKTAESTMMSTPVRDMTLSPTNKHLQDTTESDQQLTAASYKPKREHKKSRHLNEEI